jgi:hypothetical protein
MSPTLADVYMITGLQVTGTVYPHKYKGSSRRDSYKSRAKPPGVTHAAVAPVRFQNQYCTSLGYWNLVKSGRIFFEFEI